MNEQEKLQAEMEAVFARMQEMMDRIPEMQEKEKELEKRKTALTFAAENQSYQAEKKKVKDAETVLQNQEKEIRRAAEAGEPQEKIDQMVRDLEIDTKNFTFMEEKLMGYRTKFHQDLRRAGIKGEEEYRKVAGTEQEVKALEEEIRSYQDEYQKVFERCQELDAMLPEEE